MSSRSLKALKAIVLGGGFHRIWQILMKSRLVHLSAFLHGLLKPNIKKARLALYEQQQLASTELELVKELNQHGFARVDTLFSPEDFAPLRSYLEEKLRSVAQAKSNQLVHTKDFWVRLSDEDLKKGMTEDHPLVRLSLKENLLRVVSGYLQQAPYLEYILLTFSQPSPQPLKSSQLWHQDHDNDRMIKFFVYLSDVNKTDDGPFTLLSREANGSIRNSFFPRHLSDSEVEGQYPLKHAVQIKGPRFSAFLVDTSVCYHMGSRVAEDHSRLMSTSLYVTLPKAYWNQIRPFVRSTQHLSPLANAAIDSSLHGPHSASGATRKLF